MESFFVTNRYGKYWGRDCKLLSLRNAKDIVQSFHFHFLINFSRKYSNKQRVKDLIELESFIFLTIL